eukprot:SAG11_NODE_7610_length_1121_cov_1.828767_2_plen_50_part_00
MRIDQENPAMGADPAQGTYAVGLRGTPIIVLHVVPTAVGSCAQVEKMNS